MEQIKVEVWDNDKEEDSFLFDFKTNQVPRIGDTIIIPYDARLTSNDSLLVLDVQWQIRDRPVSHGDRSVNIIHLVCQVNLT